MSLILGILLLVLGVLWASWILTYLTSIPLQGYIGPSPSLLSYIGGLSIFGVIGIPILSLMLLITRWFSSYRIPKEWRSYLRLGWVVSFVLAAITVFMTAMSFNARAEEISENIIYHEGDVLEIVPLRDVEYENNGLLQIPGIIYTSEALISELVEYEIHKSEDSEMRIKVLKETNGKGGKDAKNLLSSMNLEYQIEGDKLFLPENILINDGYKFRGQSALVQLYIPQGKRIKIDRSILRKLNNSVFEHTRNRTRNTSKYTWTMGKNGLDSQEWNDEYRAERELSTANIQNLNINGNLEVIISQGSQASAVLKGSRESLNNIEEVNTEGGVSINAVEYIGSVKLEITTPNLESLQAKELRGLKVEGFKQDNMELNFSGYNLKSEIYVDVENLNCTIAEYGTHTFIGSAKKLNINLLESSRIIADQFKAEDVHIEGRVSNGSFFTASQNFACDEYRFDNIELYGNPEVNLIKRDN